MELNLTLSPVKRERLKKQEQQRLKLEMRAALPVLTRDEIRRYRLPHYLALLEELEVYGYLSSKEYLQQLLNYQESIRQVEGPNSAQWLWPELKNERRHLDRIYDALKRAEDAHNSDSMTKEFEEFIELGVFYGFGNKVWWWLGEQFLVQAIRITQAHNIDEVKPESLVKYIYGKFLKLNKREFEGAIPYLKQARKLSKRMSWSAKNLLKSDSEDTVYNESCKLLYEIFMAQATAIYYTKPKQAVLISNLARNYACNACDRAKEADALMFQGMCFLEASNPRNATVVLLKSLLLNKKLHRHEEICKARINLALAYIKVDNFAEAIKHLKALQFYAKKMDLPYYIGQTYRYLGEYYINQGEPQLALPILEKAVLIFHELNCAYERLQVNNFSAIARGQLLFRDYAHLIIRSGYPENNNNLMQLVDWKDSRVKFWSQDEMVDESESIESTQSVYRLQKHDVEELNKGLSRMLLCTLTSVKFDEDEASDTSSSSTASSLSLNMGQSQSQTSCPSEKCDQTSSYSFTQEKEKPLSVDYFKVGTRTHDDSDDSDDFKGTKEPHMEEMEEVDVESVQVGSHENADSVPTEAQTDNLETCDYEFNHEDLSKNDLSKSDMTSNDITKDNTLADDLSKNESTKNDVHKDDLSTDATKNETETEAKHIKNKQVSLKNVEDPSTDISKAQ